MSNSNFSSMIRPARFHRLVTVRRRKSGGTEDTREGLARGRLPDGDSCGQVADNHRLVSAIRHRKHRLPTARWRRVNHLAAQHHEEDSNIFARTEATRLPSIVALWMKFLLIRSRRTHHSMRTAPRSKKCRVRCSPIPRPGSAAGRRSGEATAAGSTPAPPAARCRSRRAG